MVQEANHIIRNAIIDFHHNGKADGFALQREVNDWFDDLIANLDTALSSTQTDHSIVSIDRISLEINLPEIGWRQHATQQVIKQLLDKLRLTKAGIIDNADYKENNELQHFEQFFLYFLEHGHLHWQAAGLTTAQWRNALLEMVEKADHRFIQALKKILGRLPVAQTRFLQTVSLEQALKLFTPGEGEKENERQQFGGDLQLLAIRFLAGTFSSFSKDIYRLLLLSFPENADLVLAKKLLFASIQKENDAELISAIKGLSLHSQTFTDLQKELVVKGKKSPFEIEDGILQWQQLIDKEKAIALSQAIDDHAFEEGFFISNAGLVIVAAFLPVLFERIKLVADQKILDIDTAVCLVNYLATGNEKIEEYELVLPKILCGIAPSAVIDTNVFFHEDVKQEAADLLMSVIEYWSILKDTSPTGLQETFLQRNGKISYKNNEWLLQVERKQFDMLLDQLPWNISMIKLTWMPGMLKTEWT